MDGGCELPRSNTVLLHKPSMQKLCSGPAVNHGHHILLSPLATQSYWDVEVLSIMIELINKQ